MGKTLLQLGEGKKFDVHSCKLDCQGKAIHLLANSLYLAYSVYLRWPHCLGSLAKKRYSIFQGKWSELYLLLSAQAQGCPARHQDEQVRQFASRSAANDALSSTCSTLSSTSKRCFGRKNTRTCSA